MPNKFSIAPLVFAVLIAGPAFAQTNPNPACARTGALASQSSGSGSTTSMADTSSGAGNAGSGASSASIATGPFDKTGVNNPCVTSTTGRSTGALPNSTGTGATP